MFGVVTACDLDLEPSLTSEMNQAVQPIPGYFYGNAHCHYKTYEIKRNQTEQLVEGTFASQFEKFTAICELTQTVQSLENKQNGGQKAVPFESKCC